MCLDLFSHESFLINLRALWLSTLNVSTKFSSSPIAKQIMLPIHVLSRQAKPSATYPASADEVVTIDCFFDFQEIAAPPKRKTYPLVGLRPSLHPVQLASQYPFAANVSFVAPHRSSKPIVLF